MAKRIFDATINLENQEKLKKFIFQEDFNKKLTDVRKLNLSIMQNPTQSEFKIFDSYNSNATLELFEDLNKPIELDMKKGQIFSTNTVFGGYDESKLQFLTLEGTLNITSHSLLEVTQEEYLPIGYITIYFYTRASEISNKSSLIRFTNDAEGEANGDYAKDRNELISNNIPENSILFIDGPLIGGNITSYSLKLIEQLHEKNVLPVFFVKNSESNLIADNLDNIRNKYNSDLHWAYNFLKPGQRTNLFLYTDKVNNKNTKLFCYIKPFDRTSPQRIELHPETYELYKDYMGDVFDLIYYLMLVQGDRSNPQIRPIAIAEKYAREMIKTVNIQSLLKYTSLIPTINQERFGG